MREIGSRRELFVDRYLIQRLDGVQLKLHSPQPAGVALRLDRPWEGAYSGYFTVIKDGPKYRMYYRGLPVLQDGSEAETTCYAQSDDGISWNRPNLGLYEVCGTKQNNVVLHGHAPASHNFSPFLDSKPGVPASERFKAAGGLRGLLAFASEDGIHWKKLREEPIITEGAFDSQNVVFWSETEGLYVCYFRTFSQGVRSVSRATSPNFLTWSKPVAMHYGDAPPEHLYTNQTHPYFRAPHIYISLPMRFFPGRTALSDEVFKKLQVRPEYASYARSECSDGVFVTSRAGNQYDRTFLEAFFRPGLDPGNWVSRSMMAALGVVPTGPAEMSLYYHQHDGQTTFHLLRATLRTDGFASVHASYQGGEIVTRPLKFAGKELTINYSTSAAGSIRVEIQDEAGKPIPGYRLTDATEIIGDQIERAVAWKAGTDLGALAERPVRLRFVLKDADLYSLRFR
ncbi:MAG: hypothetical protein HUU20_02255 [Pirellulales bacterium]|nr:hypothetical protein [Pirellulales bacterium]